jgi:hypothetical protein
MQLNAITRKSALMAILLLVTILVSVAVRYVVAPFEVELADCEYRERVITIFLAMFLLLCCGVVEGKMLPRSGLSSGYCTLPIPLYGLLACGVFVAPNLLATAVASLAFAVAMHLLLRSLHSAEEKDSVFFASMLLGAMVLLSPPSVVLVATIPIAVFVLALSLRQALLMAVGYVLPLFSASYVVWYKGGTIFEFWQNLYSTLMTTQMSAIENIPFLSISMVAVVIAVLLWGMVYAVVRPDKMFMLSRVRRALYLFLWVSLLSLTMLFIPACSLSACAIVAVPAAILLSFVLGILPNNHATIAYWLLLALFVSHLFVA